MESLNRFRTKYNADILRKIDLASVAPSDAMIPGRVQINGAGEASFDVPFSVRFTTLPYFTFGFETLENQKITEGQKPTGTAYVESWKTVERLPLGVYYVGARIVAVTTGPSTTKMIMHYNFAARALSNPSVE